MANNLAAVIDMLLAQGLLALRGATIMPRIVNRGYETMAGEKGSSITIPVPSAITAIDVAPGATPPANADSVPTSVSVPLTSWKEAPFYLTDKDQMEAASGIIPMQASEAVKAIAAAVNADILSKYKGVYGFTGTAGTTPFASDLTAGTNARKILNKQLAPLSDRRFVLDPDAEGNALNLRAFQDQGWRGNGQGIIEGQLGRTIGFDWFMDQQVPTHTAGTITTGLATKSATNQGIGTTALVCTTAASTGACALKQGDIIHIAGDAQTYVVTADATQASAATDVTVNISPALKVAVTGGQAVTVEASHAVNLAFHRDAFAFVTRPLLDVQTEGLGAIVRSAVDPVSGLTLRLEVTRQHKQTRFSYDMLWGSALVRADLATRLAG